MDSLDDPTAEIIKQIAKRGAFVGFDRVTSQRPSDDQRVTEVLALLEAGYADRLLLSSDKRQTSGAVSSLHRRFLCRSCVPPA